MNQDVYCRWLTDHGLTPLQVCLSFAMSQPEVSWVVVGVDSLKQLREILAFAKNFATTSPESMMSDDLDLINSSRWSSL